MRILEQICYPGWHHPRDIQRWSALIQNNFRHFSALFFTWKSLNSADSALNSAENKKNSELRSSAVSALIQSWTALIPSETALNSADFWQIQNYNGLFFLFSKFWEVLQFWGTLWIFSAQFAKRSGQQKFSSPIFLLAKIITITQMFRFSLTAQITEFDIPICLFWYQS